MAIAPQTDDQEGETQLFIKQLDVLIRQNLMQDDRHIFDFATQSEGFIALAILYLKHSGFDRREFHRAVDSVWDNMPIAIVTQEQKQP